MTWTEAVGNWYNVPNFKALLNSKSFHESLKEVALAQKKSIVYPNSRDMFRAFKETQPDDLKVVILGQDPYHDGSATGLAFGNEVEDKKMSPSLRKILELFPREVVMDEDKTLISWARQGVLLLNTALTVERGKAYSHAKLWEEFTCKTITTISVSYPDTIFMLWGKNAQGYTKYISDKCTVLTAEHPAYAARMGRLWECDNFDKANELLTEPINW